MRLDKALRLSAENIHSCFLCNSGRLAVMGVFVPDNPALFVGGMGAVPPGKTRTIVYALCSKCAKLPDRTDAVEERMRLQ